MDTDLKTALAHELVSLSERNLDDATEFQEGGRGVVLDIGNAFEVLDELVDQTFPGDESTSGSIGSFSQTGEKERKNDSSTKKKERRKQKERGKKRKKERKNKRL